MTEYDDIDSLYRKFLQMEIGSAIGTTDRIPLSIFENEHAFALMLSSIKRDFIPFPPALDNGQKKHDESIWSYRFKMTDLEHDTLMRILTTLKTILPADEAPYPAPKANKLRKELESLGIGYMGSWIVACKNGTYTIDIRGLRYAQARLMAKAMFDW